MAPRRSVRLSQAVRTASPPPPPPPPPPPQESAFFDLSPELRNLIYEYLMERPEEVWVCADRRYQLEDGTLAPRPVPPAMTQVCRLIRAETLPMFFGNATVSITLLREKNVAQAKRWADATGDDGIKSVRRFRLSGPATAAKQPGFFYIYMSTFRIWVDKAKDDGIRLREQQELNSRCEDSGQGLKQHRAMCCQMEASWRSLRDGDQALECAEDVKAMIEAFAQLLDFRRNDCP